MTETSKAEDLYRNLINQALAPVIRRAVHPETTFAGTGEDLPRHASLLRHAERMGHQPKPPLAPRERLAARLTLVMVLTECKNQLVKEILADVESIEDAKRSGGGFSGL